LRGEALLRRVVPGDREVVHRPEARPARLVLLERGEPLRALARLVERGAEERESGRVAVPGGEEAREEAGLPHGRRRETLERVPLARVPERGQEGQVRRHVVRG